MSHKVHRSCKCAKVLQDQAALRCCTYAVQRATITTYCGAWVRLQPRKFKAELPYFAAQPTAFLPIGLLHRGRIPTFFVQKSHQAEQCFGFEAHFWRLFGLKLFCHLGNFLGNFLLIILVDCLPVFCVNGHSVTYNLRHSPIGKRIFYYP